MGVAPGRGSGGAVAVVVVVVVVLVASGCLVAGGEEALGGFAGGTGEIAAKGLINVPEAKNLGPWAKGLLKGMPATAAGPSALAPESKFPLVLAAERTRRPDVLDHLRLYRGGWDITNKHYWASVSFTGVVGLVLAALWFISFGIALGTRCFCKWRMGKDKVSHADRICPVLLVVFTLALMAGCIVLYYGQNEFHGEASRTLDFVVNQSDFTVQILRNVTDYLSFAKTINVAALYLPSDVQGHIDNLKGDLNNAADTISLKTTENYRRIRKVIHNVCSVLIIIALLMPVLAFVGYMLSVYGQRHAIYIFVGNCWVLVAVIFTLLGIFVIINSAAKDTCEAMNEWAQYPQAETALSNILPCVDQNTTNRTLYQSKQVVVLLVKIVNRAISALSNRRPHHKHPGQLMPYLCSPYDSDLNDRQCKSREVPFANASTAWLNYTCMVPDSDLCTGPKSITLEIYSQLVLAANVSYALYHYTPLLLNLQDCKFVRDTFSSISSHYCPALERDLTLVSVGLAFIASSAALRLLWVFYADHPRREEVSAPPSGAKIAPLGSSP